MIIVSDNSSSPTGLVWDSDNYSCAYDVLLTILYEIWSTDTKAWTRRFKEIKQHHLKSMSACFKKYMNGQASFEKARDTIRHELHSQNPAQFPYGTRGTSVSNNFCPSEFVATSSPECTNYEYSEASIDDRLDFVLYETEDRPKSHSQWLRSLEHETHERSPE